MSLSLEDGPISITDLDAVPNGHVFNTEIVIVGAGPAGLTIAGELARSGLKVLIVESGNREFTSDIQSLNAVENVGEPIDRDGGEPLERGYTDSLAWLNDVAPFELRNRMIGGSTNTWVGKCAAFDDIDFQARPWLSHSGWPIARRDLDASLDRIARTLNLGPNVYDSRLQQLMHSRVDGIALNPSCLRSFYWQFSHEKDQPGEPMRFANKAGDLEALGVQILTQATVTKIVVDKKCTRATGLLLASPAGVEATVNATTIVLCAGGIENARLLLASNSVARNGIGNDLDVVGRFLADHPRTTLCRFHGAAIEQVATHFSFFGVPGQVKTHFYLHGVSLSPEIQERDNLTNCAAYPVNDLAPDDPWTALKRLRRKPNFDDTLAVLRKAPMVAAGLYRRLVLKHGLPRKAIQMRFDVMAEQKLDPESRVTLSEKCDRFGVPIARVNWRVGDTEIRSMRRLALLIRDEFLRLGLPEPELPRWINEADNSKATFMDMAHPSCTTRMGKDPASSVVDENAMVHGVNGLFIAGSSVFPTPGHANPTLMILAMALRLADHLKVRHSADATLEQAA